MAGGRKPAYYHNSFNATGPVITISSSGANAGFVRLYYQDIWASDCSFINYQQTDYLYSIFVYLKLQQDEIYRNQQGAVQPHIYPSDLMKLKIPSIPFDIMREYESLVSPLFEHIAANKEHSQTLANMRDLLLPKLMTGKIRIHDMEVINNV